MRTFWRMLTAVILFNTTAIAASAGVPIPPAPTAWVTDTAGSLSPQTIDTENTRLRSYQRNSGHQVLVYITPSTGGDALEDWTVRAFAKWKIGRKGLDDGLVLFIFPRDRTVRIEVGYGLEAAVPDALASRIVRDTVVPQMRAGLADRAVTLGVEQLLRLTSGEVASSSRIAENGLDRSASRTESPPPLTPPNIIFIAILIVGFILLAIWSPWTALYLLMSIFSGRGGGMGGESAEGGGGRSGGGGASGKW